MAFVEILRKDGWYDDSSCFVRAEIITVTCKRAAHLS